jgi:hypothetical protein
MLRLTGLRLVALSSWWIPLSSYSAFAGGKDRLPAPVIVMTGGYDSCKYDSEGQWSAFAGGFNSAGVGFINELHQDWTNSGWSKTADQGIRWVFGCHDKTGGLYVHSSSDASISDPIMDLHPIISRIENLSDHYQRPIFVIGHSHGGWLAARIMENLRQPIRTGYLATLDPISFVDCNPAVIADAFWQNAGWLPGVWGHLDACRDAPRDFTAASIAQIRKNLGGSRWRSYYQTNFSPLHSGPFQGADTNLDMSPFFSVIHGGAAASWNAHIRMSTLSSIWAGLRAAIDVIYSE